MALSAAACAGPGGQAGAARPEPAEAAASGDNAAASGDNAAASEAGEAAAAARAPVWSARPTPAWDRYFRGRAGCFAVLDVRAGATVRNDPARCAARFRPFSTFKIPNTLIGLETGVVTGPDHVLDWDRRKYRREARWPAVWLERNDLRAAFRHSVVPFYRELASRVGEAAMREWIDRLGYGNRDISGGLDRFWLDGAIAISADEQLVFLSALHAGDLPVSARAREVLADIFTEERTDAYALAGKTGTGKLDDGTALGWYVGWVERGGDVYVFALNLSGATWDDVKREERMEMTRAMLRDLGALPEQPARPISGT